MTYQEKVSTIAGSEIAELKIAVCKSISVAQKVSGAGHRIWINCFGLAV